MDMKTLIERMRKMAVGTGGLNCLGCGFEHGCNVHGCAVLKDAATALSTLQAENEKLRAELDAVRAERDAAVEDVAAIIGDIEEIRQRYGVDNADADNAFAELCETYCANNSCLCYKEGDNYKCEYFKWRGPGKGD